jgi:hypothetical protein
LSQYHSSSSSSSSSLLQYNLLVIKLSMHPPLLHLLQ